MISITHFAVPRAEESFEGQARVALEVLAARPGFVRGSAGRSTDDAEQWVLVTQWRDIGSYRRALGNYEVKLHATPLMAQALDQASSFEALVEMDAGGSVEVHRSDLA
jgi:heme oxygenase (mycobilin-producing)